MKISIKLLGIVHHDTLLLLVLTSVPLLRHYIIAKPQHEHILIPHLIFGVLLVSLFVTGPILTNSAKKNQT